MLACGYDYGDYDFYVQERNWQPLNTKYSRKCYSCGKKIAVGEDCLPFDHYRKPRTEYEERRFGDEVYLKDLFHCEECGSLWQQFRELGYSVIMGDMREALRQYQEFTNFDPKKYQIAE